MQLSDILYGAMKTYSQAPVDHIPDGIQPWSPGDLVCDAKILVWKVCIILYTYLLFKLELSVFSFIIWNLLFQGIGNSVATWQPCHLVLSGLYLYTFESERSLDYQRYLWFVLLHPFFSFMYPLFFSFFFFFKYSFLL